MPYTRIAPPHGPDALDRLRDLIVADGRTQSAIAAAAGMSPQQLSHVVVGERRNPSLGTIARILAALGKTWADLSAD